MFDMEHVDNLVDVLFERATLRSRKGADPITGSYWCPFSRDGIGDEEEDHWGECKTDPYGYPITSLTVKELLTCKTHESVRDSHVNTGIWKYLEEIDKKTPTNVTKVALYFS